MKSFLIAIIAIAYSFALSAQQVAPVKFIFTTERISDTTVLLKAAATIEKGTQLFSTKKGAVDDVFISSLQLDSSLLPYQKSADTVVENGALAINSNTDTASQKLYIDSVTFSYLLHISNKDSVSIRGNFNWLAKKGDEFISDVEKIKLSVVPTVVQGDVTNATQSSIAGIFWFCFIAGLLAVLTPCVFPLIPVTVSFFLKKSTSKAAGIRNALWYSLCIMLIYTVPTLLLTLVFGDTILYTISTSAISNLLFFTIFVVFAISFFGAFDISLPNSWANKADANAGKGGLLGIFFMALTLVIVSFSCTGPIVGTLLGQTSSKGITLAPIIGMLGFSVGLALPFSLFALFPSMLQSLPKSGGWLNSVKVCFGFIELALALKFLSNVDLIYHWRLLDREIFLSLWIVIFILLGMYLLGKLKFSHDSDTKYVSIPRLFFAIAAFTFSVYMIPGLWGAPLKGLTGLVPPATTQDFNLHKIVSNNSNVTNNPNNAVSNNMAPKKYIDKLSLPFGLVGYFDLQEGLAAAKALKKPIMLDFTGHSCANCRKMEEEVWSNPEVLNRLQNNFIIVSLYVDEPTELPDAEQYKDEDGKLISTVGERNLDYEKKKFNLNAQPLYMFIDANENVLDSYQYGYDNDVKKFIAHLDKVKAAYDKKNP